jgi:hypothetical protein
MKKLFLDPLSLDKETVAMLDERQLQQIVGGIGYAAEVADTSGCNTGGSTCSGETTGCQGGGSTCGQTET